VTRGNGKRGPETQDQAQPTGSARHRSDGPRQIKLLQSIAQLHASTSLLIPEAAFGNLVLDILGCTKGAMGLAGRGAVEDIYRRAGSFTALGRGFGDRLLQRCEPLLATRVQSHNHANKPRAAEALGPLRAVKKESVEGPQCLSPTVRSLSHILVLSGLFGA